MTRGECEFTFFFWVTELYQEGGKIPIVCCTVYIEALPPQLVFKKVFSHIYMQIIICNKAKDPQDFLVSCPSFIWDHFGHSSLPAYCNRWWNWVVGCSTACHGKYLGRFTQLSNHWKKLGLYKVFIDVRVQGQTCLWQHCCASGVWKASYSLQWAPWPCPSVTKGCPARLEDRKDPLSQIIRRSGQQNVLLIAWR